jgi:hypothetical protein
MKTAVINFTLSSLIALLEHEGINIDSVKIKLNNEATDGKITEVTLTDLIKKSKKDLEQIQTDSTRLDFILKTVSELRNGVPIHQHNITLS